MVSITVSSVQNKVYLLKKKEQFLFVIKKLNSRMKLIYKQFLN